MTTAADLIERTRSYLFAGQREALNLLTTTMNASVTTVAMTYDVDPVAAGSYIDIDLEVMYVWSVDTSAKTATVLRGALGSTATSHTAGATITANPKFPGLMVLNAINDSLAELSSPQNGLYQMVTVDPTFISSQSGYDITGATSVLDVYRITYDEAGPLRKWPAVNFEMRRDANATDFPSGFGVVLFEEAQPGATIRIQYKAPFGTFAAIGDDAQDDVGLPATANDVPCLGAALRLSSVRELQRNFNESQGGTRRPDEVPTGAQLTEARGFAMLYQRRIEEERARLSAAYPDRRPV